VANYNNIHGNFGYDYYNGSSAWESLDTRFNWWGDNTTAVMNTGGNPKNIDKIYDRYDDNGLAFVNYAGWLEQAVEPDKPSSPTLSSPANNAQDLLTNIQFVWNSTSKADEYIIQVSSQSDF